MSNALIGFLLMGSAIVIMGASLGFQASQLKPKGLIHLPDSSSVLVSIYYVGTLMANHGDGLGQCLAFAFLAIVFGLVLTLSSALVWLFVFAGFKRLTDWCSGVAHN